MKAFQLNPVNWALRVKVPLLAAAMTVGVAVVLSQVVLSRISDSQEQNLARLAGAYLDGLSTAVAPHLLRKDIWETYDVLDRARQGYEGLQARYTIVALPDDSVLAASDPDTFPVGGAVPDALRARFSGEGGLAIDETVESAWVRRELSEDGVVLGRIYAELDLSELIRDRREVLFALIVVNTLLTLMFTAAGYFFVRHMVQPVSVLARHLEHIRGGELERIPDSEIERQSLEFASLFRRFNAMADALHGRRLLARRLADEEKLALLGKLASGMAHEVNNPLGGMMNALDTLRRHGDNADVRETSLGLLERGLAGIRNVVRAALVTYKGVADPGLLARKDLEDLQFLIHHETVRRHLRLDWSNALPDEVPVEGAAVRQATLNLLLNACAASPLNGIVTFDARIVDDWLAITIADNGPGMPAPVADLLRNAKPDTMPPSGTTGLGTWTAARVILKMDGYFEVSTSPSAGTDIRIYIPLRSEEAIHAVA